MTIQANPIFAPCKEEAERILVVEGKDDCNGIYQIAARNELQGKFGLWEGGSDEGALARFGGLLLSSKGRPSILGIVLDCDPNADSHVEGPARRWAQIQGRLKDLSYQLPTAPDANGTIIEGPVGFPKVGVWLMPDNQTEGMFEDFLLRLIPSGAASVSRRVVRFAKKRNLGNFRDGHEAKAAVHTFLAWQDEPGKPFGIAIRSRMFDAEGPMAEPFVDWLRRLFQ